MEKDSLTVEATLIKMLASRDPKAIEILYDKYASVFFGLIRRIIQDDIVAEDVLKEAFIKISTNFNQYQSGKISLFTWMINICRKLSLEKLLADTLLNQNYNQAINKTVYTGNSIQGLSFNPEAVHLREGISKIEQEYKVILDLLFLQGLSQYETAKKLNIPLGTVKTRSHAALQKFKSVVSENKGEE